MEYDAPRLTHPCWWCTGFDGMTAQGTAALCSRPRCSRVRALPANGCRSWVRAPGTDDEDWPPFVALPDSGPWKPAGERFARVQPRVMVDWAP